MYSRTAGTGKQQMYEQACSMGVPRDLWNTLICPQKKSEQASKQASMLSWQRNILASKISGNDTSGNKISEQERSPGKKQCLQATYPGNQYIIQLAFWQ
jgi:hypothetical protein